jgi:hypothetical protein
LRVVAVQTVAVEDLPGRGEIERGEVEPEAAFPRRQREAVEPPGF